MFLVLLYTHNKFSTVFLSSQRDLIFINIQTMRMPLFAIVLLFLIRTTGRFVRVSRVFYFTTTYISTYLYVYAWVRMYVRSRWSFTAAFALLNQMVTSFICLCFPLLTDFDYSAVYGRMECMHVFAHIVQSCTLKVHYLASWIETYQQNSILSFFSFVHFDFFTIRWLANHIEVLSHRGYEIRTDRQSSTLSHATRLLWSTIFRIRKSICSKWVCDTIDNYFEMRFTNWSNYATRQALQLRLFILFCTNVNTNNVIGIKTKGKRKRNNV